MKPIMSSKMRTRVLKQSDSDDSKIHDPVEVFCRIRPLPDPSDTSCINLYSSTKLGFPPEVLKNRKLLQYTFNHVFTEHASQKEVFDHIALPLLTGLVKGENGLLFSYGVTGSGKTYTMSGELNNPGIVPRCIYTLFNSIGNSQTPKFLLKSDKLNGFEVQSEKEAVMERLQESKNKRKMGKKHYNNGDVSEPQFINEGGKIPDFDENLMYTVFITYIEIYNNSAYDLLDENATRSLQTKILREDYRRIVYLNNVTEIEVKSAQEAFNLYSLGNQRKRMGTTSLNIDSSRSHSIFNIRLVISPENPNESTDKNSLVISQLSLVDLAGSERTNRANTNGASLKEASKINCSLMALRHCLSILRENQQTGQHRIIPYRDTRLTHLFKNYFEGEGKVKMIVCVNPSIKDLEETLHVMKFAEITQEVKVARPETKVIEKVEKENIPSIFEELQVIRTQLSSCRGPVPRVELISAESNEIKTLILYLKRRQKALASIKSIRSIGDKFRLRLMELQDIKDRYDKEIGILLPMERTRVRDLKEKMAQMNLELDTAIGQCMEKDKIIKELQSKVNEKDFKLRQTVVDKEKHKRKIEQVSEKMTHELDSKLRRQREHYDAVMKTQSEKIELVKDILIDKLPSEASKTLSDIPKFPTEVSMIVPPLNLVESETNVTSCTGTPKTAVFDERISTGQSSHRGTPVANRRYRRSNSANDIWLQHKPANPVPLGTVLQPMIKTRKSVTKLTEMKDVVNPKQSKYLLISQTADGGGEVETQLYKGDIIPTCTGGAQVIFDDVEKLKQESPRQPKKDNLRKPVEKRAQPSVEDRCAVSLEGHSSKKLKK